MANKFHAKKNSIKPPSTGESGTRKDKVDEKTANWPGLPGKSGPNRSNGVRKVKTHAKSEGV